MRVAVCGGCTHRRCQSAHHRLAIAWLTARGVCCGRAPRTFRRASLLSISAGVACCPWCREPQFRQANATMGLKRVEYLRQCAGLPAVPPAMSSPSVLLVNRPFDAGRHIIGLDDVYDRLKRRLPPEVPVRLYLPRIESLEAQAATFASANVVVVPHGAGNANFLFLPRTAGELHALALPWGLPCTTSSGK